MPENFGLKPWRERMGLTQQQAADKLNTSLRTYQGWEQGRFSIPGVVEVACMALEQQKKEGAGKEC